MKHYDILSHIINGEKASNIQLREKAELLKQYKFTKAKNINDILNIAETAVVLTNITQFNSIAMGIIIGMNLINSVREELIIEKGKIIIPVFRTKITIGFINIIGS